jgi:tetratricopeptide (TPR) repeat protein
MADDQHSPPPKGPPPAPAEDARELADPDPDPDLDSPFKRRLALAVAVLALAAGALGWAATDASIRSGEISRRAGIASIEATKQATSVTLDSFTQYGTYDTASEIQSRHDLGVVQRELLGAAAGTVRPEQWATARARLEQLTPLLRQGRLLGRPDLLGNELYERPNTTRLTYEAEKRSAAAWDWKASLYIGGVTLLGVATTLLGLALPVPAGSRRYLVATAAVIAGVTALGAVVVATRPTQSIPSEAIRLVARGDRLTAEKNFAGAINAYSDAIELDRNYVPAYAGRALALSIEGSAQRDIAQFSFTSTSREARLAAIADLERALGRERHDYLMLANQGANYFHVRDYARTVAYSKRAIAENPDLPLPWMNAALGLAGQDRAEEARETLAQALARIGKRPLVAERLELYAAARATMAMLAVQRPDLRRLVRSFTQQITGAESADLLPNAPVARDARVSAMRVAAVGEQLTTSISYTGLPTGSALAWIVSFRPRGGDDWIERGDMNWLEASQLPPSGGAEWRSFDRGCSSGGEYRVDLYSGGHFLATSSLEVPAGASGKLVPTGNVSGSMVVCRPRSWKQASSTSWATDVRSPDGRARISVRVLPLLTPPRDDAAREALTRQILDRLARAVGGTPAAADAAGTIGNRSGSERLIDRGADRHAILWVSIADNVVRTVTLRYDNGSVATIGDLRRRILVR